MKQANSPNNGKDALQRKDDQHLTHNNAALRWLALNWRMIALGGGLTVAAGSGVALFMWLANVIDDLGQALNFIAQNSLSLFIFLAVIVQAVISNKQWRAMHDGLERTDRVIEKMEVQQRTMRTQSIAAVSEARSTRETMIETKNLVKQNESMVTAMKEQLSEMRRQIKMGRIQFETQIGFTEIAIRTAEKSAIYAERAYVTAKIRGTGDGSHQWRLRIENSGKTPANNVCVHYAYGLREKPPHEEREGQVVFDIGFTETERLGLIAPNSSYHVIRTPKTAPLSPAEHKQWVSGELKFYCWGRIVYESIFNEVRHTDFCFVESQRHPHGYPCEHGNSAI